MGHVDESITDTDDAYFDPKFDDILGEQLETFTPGIRNNMSCQAHFYVCQKMSNNDHPSNPYPKKRCGPRHYWWIEGPRNFLYFYPGKFTLAPVGAKKLVSFLSKRLDRGPMRASRTRALNVSPRPYYDTPTHIGHGTGSGFAFFPVKG